MSELRQPPWPQDVQAHAEGKLALKKLRHRILYARRFYAHAIVALDALFRELHDDLKNAAISDRPELIAQCEIDLEPYLIHSTGEAPQ